MDKATTNKEELTSLLQKEIKKIYFYPYTKLSPTILKIKTLLSKGADINSQDEKGNTLLHHIVASNQLKAYNAYIKENLPVNPLEKTKHLLDLSTVLSSYLPNPFIQNKTQETAFDLATKKNSKRERQTLSTYENAYSSFISEKQINLISYNHTPMFILKASAYNQTRQKD